MAMNYSSGLTTAQIVGSLTASSSFSTPGASQTIVTKANGKSGTSVTAGTGTLIHTTTAGKIYYVTSITISCSAAAGIEFRDGTTIAGTVKVAVQNNTAAQVSCITFTTPVPFSTGVFMDVGSNQVYVWTINGFEQ